jgi:hypothetical protein
MKKVLKITGIVFICLIVLGNIARIITRPMYENSFAAQVARANRNCPIPVALGNGAVTAIHLENEFLTYYLSYDNPFYNLMSSVDPEKVKDALLMCFLCLNGQGGNQGNVLMDKLVEENCGLKVVISSSAKGKFECSATVNEIQSLRKRFELDPHEALYSLLSMSMEAERANLPMQIEEGITMTDYSLDGENIVITAEMDESLYSIDELNKNINAVKNSMIENGVNDADSKALFDMCKVSHTGLVYRYVGNHTHKQCNIVISSDEIRRLVPTPSNVNIQ